MTTATATHTIVGFFPTRERAEAAVSELVGAGYTRDQISVIASRDKIMPASSSDTPNVGPIPETGSTEDTGEKAMIGGMAGFVIGIAALAIPGSRTAHCSRTSGSGDHWGSCRSSNRRSDRSHDERRRA